MRLLLWLCLALVSVTLTFSAWSQQRTASAKLALVIANADYKTIGSALPASTLTDAGDLAKELRRSGFEVELKTNLGRQDMQSAIDAFTNKISPDNSVLFYFSGFGAQVERKSYLYPVNADSYNEDDVRRKDGISLDKVLTDFHRKGAKVKILILDVARKSPFDRRFRASVEGLAAVNAPENTLALYSSVPGKTMDRSSTNGVFVSELIKEIIASNAAGASNRTAEDLFNQLKIGVYRASSREQIPWVSSSLVEEFYFGTQNVPQRPRQDHPIIVETKTKPRENVPLSYQSEIDLGEGEHFRECAGCPEMVVVPSGDYMMGAPDDEPDRTGNEAPRHRVKIPQRFAVGKVMVTRDEFEKFIKDTDYDPGDKCWTREADGDKERTGRSFRNPGFDQDGTHPVVCVNWDDANAYVAWLSRKTGKLYRLLSESEWEYVARAGTTTPFWWGSSISTNDANYNGNSTYYGGDGGKGENRGKTVPADMFKANPWGLYQVAGNAFEWVEDCWNDSYEHGEPSNDGIRMAENWAGRTDAEVHAGGCSRHVRRGGAWSNSAKFLRSAFREWKQRDYRASNTGLRVARTLDQSP